MIEFDDAAAAVRVEITTALCRVASGMSEMTTYLSQNLGKGVRGKLLLSAAADDGGCVPEDTVKAAAAVELLHLATLCHDDIIDDSPLRRGMPTLQARFGKRDAVICGDYLLCLSLADAASVDFGDGEDRQSAKSLVQRFSRVLGSICIGEYTQNRNRGNRGLSAFEYLRIVSGKTAALFQIAAFVGAKVGGESVKNADNIGRFGKYLGLVFQMIDDCKDYEFSETAAKKPVAQDAAAGIVTLPLILAMAREPRLAGLAASVLETGLGADELVRGVNAAGGSAETRRVAERYIAKGRTALRGVSAVKRERLTAIIEKAVGAADSF